jgi:hypothetical protein
MASRVAASTTAAEDVAVDGIAGSGRFERILLRVPARREMD